MKTTNTYLELANRVGDMVIANNLRANTDGWELYSGSDKYCTAHDDDECTKDTDECNLGYSELYQEYIITASGAGYLAKHTKEIVYYNDNLNLYLLGVTHYGTSWNNVKVTITEETI